MRTNITVTQLQCLAAVVESGGFTAAAASLHLSQSAVSQAVAALEAGLGLPLLVRGKDRAVPTRAGAAAHREALAALAALDRLQACGGRGTDLAGARLRIGGVQSATVRLLPQWIKPFQARYPKVTVTLHEGTDGEVRDWVLAGAVDLGITSRSHADLDRQAVAEDEYVVVAAAADPLAARRRIRLAALDGLPMILSGGGCETMIEELLAAADSAPDVRFMVRDNTTLAAMVREGLGFTIMPELALPEDRGGLAILRLDPVLHRTLWCVSRPGALGAAGQAFLDHVPLRALATFGRAEPA
ncbi:MAG TPA: LysR family transcriptional regulator [Aliidongia sp.]|uniref:LysR family transcriptional regulator n=1 Tax=Aliidongia sp. TaxID=1914230 RepID=UPI002DDCEAD4|nr:LysR family transcriptional regulator [Aliidongia sp.]HEV2672968.1 LysR family transcriptional regulator [Aliidongia sp.]